MTKPTKYSFHLDRLVYANRMGTKYKTKTRQVIIKADSLVNARKIIDRDYPDEKVSMFWPVLDNK